MPQPITKAEDEIIRDHHETLTVKELSRKVKRGFATVKQYMEDNGIPQYSKHKNSRERAQVERPDDLFVVELGNAELTWLV